MLTTADWLLGSNSQSAAGLSTLDDTMKGQYLVFSLTWLKEREWETLCSLHFEPPTSLKEENFICTLSEKFWKDAIYLLQFFNITSTIVPFIQK